MKPSVIPPNLTGKALYDFIVKNEALITHAKKSEIKKADCLTYSTFFVDDKGHLVDKSEVVQSDISAGKIKVALAINTTNWYDTHGDVHIPGLWKKSINDNKRNGFYLLKLHNRAFEDVIGEGLAGEAKLMTWRELGYKIDGTTEVLMFTGILEQDRNPYMFEQYQKKRVKQHSVGMRYIKFVTCVNDDDYPVQKENWDKYIEMVANRVDAEKDGYFWAVLEAQVVEGSAVLFGSNQMTPTVLVEEITDDSTKDEPPGGTLKEPQFDFVKYIQETKLLNV